MMLATLATRARALGVRGSAARRLLCSSSLSDAAVLDKLASGQMAIHKLEAELGDPVRAMRLRREHIQARLGAGGKADALGALPSEALDATGFYGQVDGACCENVVGYVPLPVGTVGPYLIDGSEYYVPMATTEGALVASTHRGARAITQAGGAHTELLADGMTRAPALALPTLEAAAELKRWLESPESLPELQEAFTSTSRFGRLLAVKVGLSGKYAHVRFKCFTGDAMGMNMVSKGVNKVVESILEKFPGSELLGLSGNFCTDKKPSAVNWIDGRGKSVAAEAVIPGDIVASVLKSTPEDIGRLNMHKNLIGAAALPRPRAPRPRASGRARALVRRAPSSQRAGRSTRARARSAHPLCLPACPRPPAGSALAGSIGGQNAHSSNILTAVFLAAGQDPAQNVESSTCLTLMEAIPPSSPGGKSVRGAPTRARGRAGARALALAPHDRSASPHARRPAVPARAARDRAQALYVSCTMPSIEVGTVGGGTNLAAQAACLGLMGLKGSGEKPGANSQQLARVVCASVMAGELSLMAALSVNHLVKAHMALGRRDRK